MAEYSTLTTFSLAILWAITSFYVLFRLPTIVTAENMFLSLLSGSTRIVTSLSESQIQKLLLLSLSNL